MKIKHVNETLIKKKEWKKTALFGGFTSFNEVVVGTCCILIHAHIVPDCLFFGYFGYSLGLINAIFCLGAVKL